MSVIWKKGQTVSPPAGCSEMQPTCFILAQFISDFIKAIYIIDTFSGALVNSDYLQCNGLIYARNIQCIFGPLIRMSSQRSSAAITTSFPCIHLPVSTSWWHSEMGRGRRVQRYPSAGQIWYVCVFERLWGFWCTGEVPESERAKQEK